MWLRWMWLDSFARFALVVTVSLGSFAVSIHRMIELGLGTDDGDEGIGDRRSPRHVATRFEVELDEPTRFAVCTTRMVKR